MSNLAKIYISYLHHSKIRVFNTDRSNLKTNLKNILYNLILLNGQKYKIHKKVYLLLIFIDGLSISFLNVNLIVKKTNRPSGLKI